MMRLFRRASKITNVPTYDKIESANDQNSNLTSEGSDSMLTAQVEKGFEHKSKDLYNKSEVKTPSYANNNISESKNTSANTIQAAPTDAAPADGTRAGPKEGSGTLPWRSNNNPALSDDFSDGKSLDTSHHSDLKHDNCTFNGFSHNSPMEDGFQARAAGHDSRPNEHGLSNTLGDSSLNLNVDRRRYSKKSSSGSEDSSGRSSASFDSRDSASGEVPTANPRDDGPLSWRARSYEPSESGSANAGRAADDSHNRFNVLKNAFGDSSADTPSGMSRFNRTNSSSIGSDVNGGLDANFRSNSDPSDKFDRPRPADGAMGYAGSRMARTIDDSHGPDMDENPVKWNRYERYDNRPGKNYGSMDGFDYRLGDPRMNYVGYKNDRSKFSPQRKKTKNDYVNSMYGYPPSQPMYAGAYPSYPNMNYPGYVNHYKQMEFHPHQPDRHQMAPAQPNLPPYKNMRPGDKYYNRDSYYASPNRNLDHYVQYPGYPNVHYPSVPDAPMYKNYKVGAPKPSAFSAQVKQIKPRQSSALQILNPDTGEVVNSTKPEPKEDKPSQSESPEAPAPEPSAAPASDVAAEPEKEPASDSGDAADAVPEPPVDEPDSAGAADSASHESSDAQAPKSDEEAAAEVEAEAASSASAPASDADAQSAAAEDAADEAMAAFDQPEPDIPPLKLSALSSPGAEKEAQAEQNPYLLKEEGVNIKIGVMKEPGREFEAPKEYAKDIPAKEFSPSRDFMLREAGVYAYRKMEDAFSPMNALRLQQMKQSQVYLNSITQLPVFPPPKTRLRIVNRPLNPAETLYTLTELHPSREMLSPSEHSRSQQRKIHNVPLSQTYLGCKLNADAAKYYDVNKLSNTELGTSTELSDMILENSDSGSDSNKSHTVELAYENDRNIPKPAFLERPFKPSDTLTDKRPAPAERPGDRLPQGPNHVLDPAMAAAANVSGTLATTLASGAAEASPPKSRVAQALEAEDTSDPTKFSTLRMISMGQSMRRTGIVKDRAMGSFKLVPLNYTSGGHASSHTGGHAAHAHQTSFQSHAFFTEGYAAPSSGRRKTKKDSKWRSELNIEKEELTAHKMKKPSLTKKEQFKRSVRTLLNKLTVENFLVVSEKIAALYKEAAEHESVLVIVDLLHEKATLELEYSDMYADLAFLLKYSFNDVLDLGSKTTSFHKALLNKCQDSFEEISTNHALNKNYILGNIRFMGELFLRKILSITILKRISCTLMTSRCSDIPGDTCFSEGGAAVASEAPIVNRAVSEAAGSSGSVLSEVVSSGSVVSEVATVEPATSSVPAEPAAPQRTSTSSSLESSSSAVEPAESAVAPEGTQRSKASDESFESMAATNEAPDPAPGSASSLADRLEFRPPANLIECFSELLTTIGYTVDQIPGGSEMLDEYLAILVSLKKSGIYPTRINFKIQDLIDLRNRNWRKKLFKEKATSVSHIHRLAEQEQLRGGPQEGRFVTAGLQTNRHYTPYLLRKRQQAVDCLVNGLYTQESAQRIKQHDAAEGRSEDCFSTHILKLFAANPGREAFDREWRRFRPSEDSVTAIFDHMLKATVTSKTLEQCLSHADILSHTLSRLVDSETLRAKLLNMFCDHCIVNLHDEILDNPWAMDIVSKTLTLLFCDFSGESRSLLEKIPIPRHFPTARQLATNIINGTRDLGGDLGFTRRVIRRHLYSTFHHENLLFLDEI